MTNVLKGVPLIGRWGAYAVAAAAVVSFVSPASAQSTSEQVDLCAAAMVDQGLAPSGDYRSKLVRTRGGSTKTVTVRVIPEGGGDAVTGVCKIKGGEVISAELKD